MWKRSSTIQLLAVLSPLVLLCGCGGGETSSSGTPPAASIAGSTDDIETSLPEIQSPVELTSERIQPPPPRKNLFPVVLIKTSLGNIKVKLNAEKAPETVDNFLLNYVDREFYTDTIVHYVEKDFIAIAGGYDAELTAKEARAPIRNESNNGLQNKRGTIAMSRLPDYSDSATSQFFFNLVDNPDLDYQESESDEAAGYCVFGEVIEGLDVVNKISEVSVGDRNDFPKVPTDSIVIQGVERVE